MNEVGAVGEDNTTDLIVRLFERASFFLISIKFVRKLDHNDIWEHF